MIFSAEHIFVGFLDIHQIAVDQAHGFPARARQFIGPAAGRGRKLQSHAPMHRHRWQADQERPWRGGVSGSISDTSGHPALLIIENHLLLLVGNNHERVHIGRGPGRCVGIMIQRWDGRTYVSTPSKVRSAVMRDHNCQMALAQSWGYRPAYAAN